MDTEGVVQRSVRRIYMVLLRKVAKRMPATLGGSDKGRDCPGGTISGQILEKLSSRSWGLQTENLSVVASSFCRSNQRLLFHSLTLKTGANSVAADALLAESPHLATYFLPLKIDFPPPPGEELDAFGRVLEKLVNVRRCEVHGAVYVVGGRLIGNDTVLSLEQDLDTIYGLTTSFLAHHPLMEAHIAGVKLSVTFLSLLVCTTLSFEGTIVLELPSITTAPPVIAATSYSTLITPGESICQFLCRPNYFPPRRGGGGLLKKIER
ncbi:hypothetical protein DFH09DRAFT_1368196 [Mycena vulgaris]|nr:hypothetical protein DFH09DRAFT_1368196 [Mycena vulgaris]